MDLFEHHPWRKQQHSWGWKLSVPSPLDVFCFYSYHLPSFSNKVPETLNQTEMTLHSNAQTSIWGQQKCNNLKDDFSHYWHTWVHRCGSLWADGKPTCPCVNSLNWACCPGWPDDKIKHGSRSQDDFSVLTVSAVFRWMDLQPSTFSSWVHLQQKAGGRPSALPSPTVCMKSVHICHRKVHRGHTEII